MLRFFRQLFTRSVPETDLSYGLLTETGADGLLAAQRWDELEASALQLAPDDLTRWLDGLCLTNRYAAPLAQYQASGQSELRTLVAGARALHQAWESRGGQVATETSQQQVDGFVYYLEQALDLLNQPLAQPTLQAEASARLVRVGMGLNEPELAAEAFAHCTELVPTHLMGHYHYLRLLSPWWHGSPADLTALADSVADPDLRQWAQLMCLHELHSYAAHELGNTAQATAQLRHDHAARLAAALAAPPQQPGTSLLAVYYTNYLAALHHVLGNLLVRNNLLRKLGPRITPYPWSYFGLTTAAAVQQLAA